MKKLNPEICFADRVYFGGDVLSGVVRLSLDDLFLLDEELTLTFEGNVQWTTQESETVTTTNSDGSTSTSTETRTVHHSSNFVKQLVQCILPVPKGRTLQVNRGVHEFPFSTVLPSDSLFPSCQGDPGVYYTLGLLLGSGFGFRAKAIFQNVTIGGYTEPRGVFERRFHTPWSLEGRHSFLGDSGAIIYQVRGGQSAVVKGQRISLSLDITNTSRQTITGIVARFTREKYPGGAVDELVSVCNVRVGCGETVHVERMDVECPADAQSSFNDVERSGQMVVPLNVQFRVESALRMDVRFSCPQVMVCYPFPTTTPDGTFLSLSSSPVKKSSIGDGVPFLLWQSDDGVDSCPLCSKSFGLFRRKHHCRMCGSVVCDDCAPKKHHIESISSKVCRVCTKCNKESPMFVK